jgi:hypothetical protein
MRGTLTPPSRMKIRKGVGLYGRDWICVIPDPLGFPPLFPPTGAAAGVAVLPAN